MLIFQGVALCTKKAKAACRRPSRKILEKISNSLGVELWAIGHQSTNVGETTQELIHLKKWWNCVYINIYICYVYKQGLTQWVFWGYHLDNPNSFTVLYFRLTPAFLCAKVYLYHLRIVNCTCPVPYIPKSMPAVKSTCNIFINPNWQTTHRKHHLCRNLISTTRQAQERLASGGSYTERSFRLGEHLSYICAGGPNSDHFHIIMDRLINPIVGLYVSTHYKLWRIPY